MACGGCKRRRESIAKIWARTQAKPKVTGEMSGGIGQKVTTTGRVAAKVRVHR